jgi:hypothetical protein
VAGVEGEICFVAGVVYGDVERERRAVLDIYD